jgi:hypothetical protein
MVKSFKQDGILIYRVLYGLPCFVEHLLTDDLICLSVYESSADTASVQRPYLRS